MKPSDAIAPWPKHPNSPKKQTGFVGPGPSQQAQASHKQAKYRESCTRKSLIRIDGEIKVVGQISDQVGIPAAQVRHLVSRGRKTTQALLDWKRKYGRVE